MTVLPLLSIVAALAAPPRALTTDEALAREIFAELIGIDTTESSGNVTRAAEVLAARFRAAGFPAEDVVLAGDVPRKKNLVVRLRGTGKKTPILLLAHLDVVEAKRADWSPDLDPFRLTEKDGYFYGRGTSDIKDGAALLATTLLRLRREGFVPARDVILALTADEETGDANGVGWLLAHRRGLVDAAYCVNTDGGDFQLEAGKKRLAAIQASEKLYVSYLLEATSPGGHSSMPGRDNAIARLAAAVTRLAALELPVRLNEVTRGWFAKMAAFESGERAADMRAVAGAASDDDAASRLSRDPYLNALLRTTCTPTLLAGGHAENALPQRATATVNCRLLPGEDPEALRRALAAAAGDPGVAVSFVRPPPPPSPPSSLEPELVSAMERTIASLWPGVPVVPVMETGGTDGSRLRPAGIPTFGVSGVFIDFTDARAHGKDERIPVASFYEGLEFFHRLVRALGAGN